MCARPELTILCQAWANHLCQAWANHLASDVKLPVGSALELRHHLRLRLNKGLDACIVVPNLLTLSEAAILTQVRVTSNPLCSWARLCSNAILVFRSPGKKDHAFEASLDYIGRPCLVSARIKQTNKTFLGFIHLVFPINVLIDSGSIQYNCFQVHNSLTFSEFKVFGASFPGYRQWEVPACHCLAGKFLELAGWALGSRNKDGGNASASCTAVWKGSAEQHSGAWYSFQGQAFSGPWTLFLMETCE